MSDNVKIVAVVVAGLVFISGFLAYENSYRITHLPPISQCENACGFHMVKSYDPQNGCVCR